jgi:hypothetical protein
LQVQFRLQITLRLFAPFAKTHPSFAPRCAPALPAAGVTYPPPVPRTGPPTYTTGSGTGSGQRIRHGLRIVCRRLCPPVPARGTNAQKRPSEPLQERGDIPNPRRRKIVALKGSFCVGLLPAPGGLWSVAPATGAAATTELPPRCCPAAAPAAGATRCTPTAPGCQVRDGVRRIPWVGTGPTRPTQDQQDRSDRGSCYKTDQGNVTSTTRWRTTTQEGLVTVTRPFPENSYLFVLPPSLLSTDFPETNVTM